MDKDVFMVKQAKSLSPSIGIGLRPRPRATRRSKVRTLALLGASAALALACNGGTDGTPKPSTPTGTQEGSTATSPPSSQAELSTTTTPLSADQIAAVEAWRTLWNAATRQPGTEHAARSAAEPAAVDRLFALTREPRVVVSSPTPAERDDRTISIADCLFVSPSLSTSATIGIVGTVAKQNDGTWRVADLAPRNGQLQPCVPAALAASAINGYEAHWDARRHFWDPANPDDPLVAQTTTGPQRALIERLLREHRDRNVAFRGRPTTHPEVIEVRSPSEVVILDCQLADPDTGLFKRDSGAREPDVDPVSPGQRDLDSAVMRMESGTWKVSDVQGQVGVTCDFSPTTKGLPAF
jgi:hypothetical protein